MTTPIEREFVTYELVDDGCIARVWLNRSDAQNAQHRALLLQLDEAFTRAETDDNVRVVILGARGANFSAGHDMGSEEAIRESRRGPNQHPSFRINGGSRKGVEKRH